MRARMYLVTVAVAALPLVAAGQELHLTCDGATIVSQTVMTSTPNFDYVTGRILWANGSTNYSRQVATEVKVDIDGETGRIWLPDELLPRLIRNHSDHGWRPFTALQVSDSEIDARVALNFAYKAVVAIKRTTGFISIDGGSFVGVCQGLAPANTASTPADPSASDTGRVTARF